MNLEIFNSGFFNLHRQKKKNEISWWSIDKKILNKITKSITDQEVKKYFSSREKGKSKYTDATLSNFKFKKKFLYQKNLFFLHIFKDSPFNFIDQSRIFKDYNDWIIRTIKILNSSNEKWSFRLHPSCKEWGENQKFIIKDMINKYSNNKENFLIDENIVPIKHVFQYAKRCITFSGTIHLESAAYGIKPIVISEVMLNKYDLNSVIKPKTINQYKNILLTKSNSDLFKIKQNKTLFAKKLIFVREKFYFLKTNLILNSSTDVMLKIKKKLIK